MFKKIFASVALVAASLGMVACNDTSTEVAKSADKAHSVKYVEGKHYRTLEQGLERPSNEVLEFFWYGCPHCYEAEHVIKPWAEKNKGKYTLTQKHSHLSPRWMFDAFVFYGLEGTGRLNELGSEFFDKRQAGDFADESDFIAWLDSKGLTKEQLEKAATSPEMVKQRDELSAIEQAINGQGVPTFVVGGKYVVLINGLQSMGGWSGLPGLLEYLADKK